MPAGIYKRKKKDYGLRTCVICGKQFGIKNQKPHRFQKQKCCSRECNAKLAATHCLGKKAHNNKQVKRICKWCGKEQMVSPSLSHRPFCSRKCMGEWMSEKQSGQNHWNWQGGKWKRYCLQCGREFYFDKGDLKKGKNSRLFCSQSCCAKYSHKGKGNPNWKGGIQPENSRIRNSPEIKEWKIKCLKRDDYACQKCGAIEGLHVHHIKSFSKYPEHRTDIANGITLCGGCHYEVHRKI